MKPFNDKNFLLDNAVGQRLFHEVAHHLPIIDWHNHIDPSLLAGNKAFKNLYELWIQHDPYKHRAMRIYGVPESLITGTSASDHEKYLAWANCFPHLVGNPLFHWSCMELKQVFGIEKLLTPHTAEEIWNTANQLLQQDNYRATEIIKRFGVELLCTSDDLLDSLEHHAALSVSIEYQDTLQCLPSLRGDKMLSFNAPDFFTWLYKLEHLTGIKIQHLGDYKKAIASRIDVFDAQGCLLSDHSLDSGFQYVSTTPSASADLFDILLDKKSLSEKDCIQLQSHVLHYLGVEYAKRKWKMQLHIGAQRFTSTHLRNKAGAAGGYACIGNAADTKSLCLFLDELDVLNSLPKTVLYTMNPSDNAVFASITGSFSEDNIKGKIQFGPAWWYNDHYHGIEQQLKDLSSYGLLSTTIGFTTDSRSILSFTRHEYYRRIVCNMIGSWVEGGKLPDDKAFLNELVENIAYQNIKHWIKK